VGTNASQHTGQRQVFHDNFQGFFVFTDFDHVDVALHVQAARTGQTTGCFVAFFNRKGTRDSLGIFLVSCLFGGKTFLIVIRQINRANRGTFTAAGAFGDVYIASIFSKASLKVSLFAVKIQ
jgi:hypothetical protein